VKLVIVLLLSSLGLAQQSATTSGPCSPISPHNAGTITINCPGIPKELSAQIITLFNRVLKNQDNSKATLAKVDECVQDVRGISTKFETKFEELREQVNGLGDTVSRTNLLARYPLGYVIFEADYKEQVFPYQSGGLEDYKIDWSVVRLIKKAPDQFMLRLPDVNKRDGTGTSAVQNGTIEGNLRVGDAGGYGHDNISVWGEILAIKDSGIVFLIGFAPMPHLPPSANPDI